jgi:hypothetical protein
MSRKRFAYKSGFKEIQWKGNKLKGQVRDGMTHGATGDGFRDSKNIWPLINVRDTAQFFSHEIP